MTRFITVHASQGFFIARNVGYRSIGHGLISKGEQLQSAKIYRWPKVTGPRLADIPS
jgi:hypothetical protein